uniref:Uncharacterized protein n=1 Tax=viral metagenome TaxID=1070528 RepID=A0A6M3XMW3_9ZZZZ
MSMTEEERDLLKQEIIDCKYHCKESWQTILQLRKLLRSYEGSHKRWKHRLEVADRALAEEERVRVVTHKEEKQDLKQTLSQMTQEELQQLIDEVSMMGGGKE